MDAPRIRVPNSPNLNFAPSRCKISNCNHGIRFIKVELIWILKLHLQIPRQQWMDGWHPNSGPEKSMFFLKSFNSPCYYWDPSKSRATRSIRSLNRPSDLLGPRRSCPQNAPCLKTRVKSKGAEIISIFKAQTLWYQRGRLAGAGQTRLKCYAKGKVQIVQ